MAKPMAAKPMVSEIRVPKMTRLKTSRKLPSVPRMCCGLSAGQPRMWMHGAARFVTPGSTFSRPASGSNGAIWAAKMAQNTSRPRIVSPTTADRCRRTLASVSRLRLAAGAEASGSTRPTVVAEELTTGAPSRRPDPRVEVAVRDVDDEVHRHVGHGDDQGEALDHDIVAAGDGLEHGPPN